MLQQDKEVSVNKQKADTKAAPAYTTPRALHHQRLHPIAKVLRGIGHCVPNIRYIRAIPNLVLKPLHNRLGLGGGVVRVLDFYMQLDPRECVDGLLWFAPHLYDRGEMDILISRFPEDGVFVDAGANIGFWSLRFATRFSQSRVVAIEANPTTFAILQANIDMNRCGNITACNVGIADADGVLNLYCNETGNRGGDSFSEAFAHARKSVQVPVRPLLDILVETGIDKIDAMKMDIEGFESRVLGTFFATAPRRLFPKLICLETQHDHSLIGFVESASYRVVQKVRENTIFELAS